MSRDRCSKSQTEIYSIDDDDAMYNGWNAGSPRRISFHFDDSDGRAAHRYSRKKRMMQRPAYNTKKNYNPSLSLRELAAQRQRSSQRPSQHTSQRHSQHKHWEKVVQAELTIDSEINNEPEIVYSPVRRNTHKRDTEYTDEEDSTLDSFVGSTDSESDSDYSSSDSYHSSDYSYFSSDSDVPAGGSLWKQVMDTLSPQASSKNKQGSKRHDQGGCNSFLCSTDTAVDTSIAVSQASFESSRRRRKKREPKRRERSLDVSFSNGEAFELTFDQASADDVMPDSSLEGMTSNENINCKTPKIGNRKKLDPDDQLSYSSEQEEPTLHSDQLSEEKKTDILKPALDFLPYNETESPIPKASITQKCDDSTFLEDNVAQGHASVTREMESAQSQIRQKFGIDIGHDTLTANNPPEGSLDEDMKKVVDTSSETLRAPPQSLLSMLSSQEQEEDNFCSTQGLNGAGQDEETSKNVVPTENNLYEKLSYSSSSFSNNPEVARLTHDIRTELVAEDNDKEESSVEDDGSSTTSNVFCGDMPSGFDENVVDGSEYRGCQRTEDIVDHGNDTPLMEETCKGATNTDIGKNAQIALNNADNCTGSLVHNIIQSDWDRGAHDEALKQTSFSDGSSQCYDREEVATSNEEELQMAAEILKGKSGYLSDDGASLGEIPVESSASDNVGYIILKDRTVDDEDEGEDDVEDRRENCTTTPTAFKPDEVEYSASLESNGSEKENTKPEGSNGSGKQAMIQKPEMHQGTALKDVAEEQEEKSVLDQLAKIPKDESRDLSGDRASLVETPVESSASDNVDEGLSKDQILYGEKESKDDVEDRGEQSTTTPTEFKPDGIEFSASLVSNGSEKENTLLCAKERTEPEGSNGAAKQAVMQKPEMHQGTVLKDVAKEQEEKSVLDQLAELKARMSKRHVTSAQFSSEEPFVEVIREEDKERITISEQSASRPHIANVEEI